MSRQRVAEACGFNETSLNQLAEAVPGSIADSFLRAAGFDRRFAGARERISAEVAAALESAARTAPPDRRGSLDDTSWEASGPYRLLK